VGFEPIIPALERAKTVHAFDRAATVIGNQLMLLGEIFAVQPENQMKHANTLPRQNAELFNVKQVTQIVITVFEKVN
jgi:hypothetical protein